MSSDATAETEMHRTDELSGGGSKTARVVSKAAEQVLHSEGQQVATQRHPSLEDVPSVQASHPMSSSAPGRSGAVPEPRTEAEEGAVLAGNKSASTLPWVKPEHHPFDKTLRWWSAMLVVLLGWWAALTAAVARLLGAHAWRQRGAQPGLQAAGASAAAAPASRPATRRSRPAAAQPLAFKVADEPSGSDPPDTLPSRSRSDGAAPSSQDMLQGSGRPGATAGSPQSLRQAVLARAQLGQPPLTWSESASNWLSGRRAGRATAGSSPLPSVSSWQALYSRRRRDSSLSEPDPHSHSHASVAALLDLDLGQDEVLRETATALRQAGHAAHEALAQVQHVLHDTPDAAAGVAGSIMGRPNYHHQAPKHAPAAPAAPPTTGGRLRRPPSRTWSDRLISHLSQPHPSQPPRTLARDSYDSTTARRLGFTEAGAAAGEQLSPQRPKSGLWERPVGPHQEFGAEDMGGDASCMVAAGPQARLVEGLRTAQQAFKNPHAASVQLAGRMLGKGNYGHA